LNFNCDQISHYHYFSTHLPPSGAEIMLWDLTTALITLVLCTSAFWWLYATPNSFQKILVGLACIITLSIDPRKAFAHEYPPAYDALLDFRLHDLRAVHIRMVLTLGAVVW
jgi:hypothetical protein